MNRIRLLTVALSMLLLVACHNGQERTSSDSDNNRNISRLDHNALERVINEDIQNLPEVKTSHISEFSYVEGEPTAYRIEKPSQIAASSVHQEDALASKKRKLQAVAQNNEDLAHRIRVLEAELAEKNSISVQQTQKIEKLKQHQ